MLASARDGEPGPGARRRLPNTAVSEPWFRDGSPRWRAGTCEVRRVASQKLGPKPRPGTSVLGQAVRRDVARPGRGCAATVAGGHERCVNGA